MESDIILRKIYVEVDRETKNQQDWKKQSRDISCLIKC